MFFKLYALALSIFFAMDMTWLGLVAKNLYKEKIGFMMKTDVNWPAAFLFYFLFIAGLVVFVIQPAVEKHSWQDAILYGAFFGLVTYATYDLTNLATTKNWPLSITVVDLVWGTVLAGTVSVLATVLAKKFF